MAYWATTVLPADVCAATSTESPRSIAPMACFWNRSNSKGKVIAAYESQIGRCRSGSSAKSGGEFSGSATSCVLLPASMCEVTSFPGSLSTCAIAGVAVESISVGASCASLLRP
eukprot:3013948-Pleurochrysis_carterae.AAC.2